MASAYTSGPSSHDFPDCNTYLLAITVIVVMQKSYESLYYIKHVKTNDGALWAKLLLS